MLTERQAASRLGFSPASLRTMRWAGRGPNYVRLGRSIRYPEHAIEAYMRPVFTRPAH